jgi:asparagine synthase (glutamine-hydrolysing)
MCGICGTIGIDNPEDAQRAVHRMSAAMLHRGPDSFGEIHCPPLAPSVALGIRRLSIIDLAGGDQPIYNENRDVALVFNGEIYNFKILRDQLERAGHRFQTKSDTEVVVHAYEEWGDRFLDHLRGMFAFALLDMRSSGEGKSLILARDRLGIKPLYYSVVDGVLVFASEVRSLLASGLVPRRLSSGALDSYLLFGSVAEPVTLVENVFAIPPGHWARVKIETRPRDIHPQPYWIFGNDDSSVEIPQAKTLDAAAAALRPILEEAVECNLIADVPLGIFLSSGLDSAAIVALASRARTKLQSFTVVFKELEFSEAEAARETARYFGTDHQEMLLEANEMLERLGDAVGALDQPTMDGINTYFVSWAARRVGLKVALSGLGGDEIFGGYSTFAATGSLETLVKVGRALPRSLRSATARAVSGIRGGSGDARRKLRALWTDSDAFPHPYFWTRAVFTPGQSSEMRTDADSEALALTNGSSPWRKWQQETVAQAASLDWFSAISCLEARTYMVQTLLRDTDSVSMAHSLEVRVPLLDHLIVNFVTKLPPEAKHRAGHSKALLVESLRDLLPEKVIRQKKRTFTFPWELWLRGPLKSRVSASLRRLSPSLAPHLDQKSVDMIWTSFQSEQTNWSRPWSLYVLNEWCRRHLEAPEAT